MSHRATKNVTDNSEDEGDQEDIVGHYGCKIRSSSPRHCVLVLGGSRGFGRKVRGNDGGEGEGRTSGRRGATFEFVVVVHDGDVRLSYGYSTNYVQVKQPTTKTKTNADDKLSAPPPNNNSCKR